MRLVVALARNARIGGVGPLAVALWLLSSGCEQLDPVYTVDLCSADGVISANCPQCMTTPVDRHCPQCQDPGADPNCPAGLAQSGSDAGSSGAAASGAEVAGRNGYAASGADGGGINTSGAGGAAANGGTLPVAGSAVLDACGSKCRLPAAVCWAKEAMCVECLSKTDCADSTCDPMFHVCVQCVSNADCPSGACDTMAHSCIECARDDQCTKNKVLNVCNAKSQKCVDCDATHGCDDDPSKPACFAEACVPCVVNDDCRDPKNKHCLRADHTCVECISGGDCPADRPACETDTHACVACLGDADCDSGHCLIAAKTCVACKVDADCGDASSARCSPDNTCTRCTTNEHCKHLTNTPACDTESGTCVACIDDSTCGDNACIQSQQTCSRVKRGSVTACGVCEADTQCAANLKCASLPIGSAPATKQYCLYSRAAVGGCAASTAAATRPFSRTVAGTSIDGVAGPYCAPQATCEALLAATNPVGGKTCAGNDDCGIAGLDDGVCNSSGRCTYGCNADLDCPKDGLRVCTGNGALQLCAQPTN